MVNSPSKGVMDRTRNWAQGRAQEEKAKVIAGRGRDTWANRRTQAIDRKRRSREGWKKANEMTADRLFTETDQGKALEGANRHEKNLSQGVTNEFDKSALGRKLDYDSRRVDLAKHAIENSHEAHWNKAIRTDSGLLKDNLDALADEKNAAVEKTRVEQLNAEITARGDTFDFNKTIPGISSRDREGLLKVSRNINRDSSVEAFTSMAKDSAEQDHHNALNDIMLKNSMTIDGKTTREYAAGIGSQDNVLASAVAKDRREFGEAAGYQKELSSHFKLNAGEIYELAMNKNAVIVKEDDSGNRHEFHGANMYTHDMAAEELFTVGSHGQKMDLLKTTAEGQSNFEYRRTIQQAAIKSGIGSIAPAINDKTLDAIINGKFKGDDSWQYHSFREVLEGRIKAGQLSTANAESLKLLFKETDSDPNTRSIFNQLVEDSIPSELKTIRLSNPAATEAEARQSLIDRFNEERDSVRNMAAQVLSNTTIRQNTNNQSVEVLKQFAGNRYRGE
jgi:hypothetical protein